MNLRILPLLGLVILLLASQSLAAPPTLPYQKPSDQELKAKLNEMQFEVTQQQGTEPPFHNAYWNNEKPGIYVDIVSGEPLFSSTDKFDSGTGWPSFTKPIDAGDVILRGDSTIQPVRIEVVSKLAGSHLGHVFDDGPAPSHKRYCINSAALLFIPVEDLEKSGYGEYLTLFTAAPAK